MKFYLDDEILEGSPIEIMEGMKERAYDPDQWKTLDEYLAWLANSVWRFHGKGLIVQGGNLEGCCRLVIDQLVAFELLQPAEECKVCGWPEIEYVEEADDRICTKCYSWQDDEEEMEG